MNNNNKSELARSIYEKIDRIYRDDMDESSVLEMTKELCLSNGKTIPKDAQEAIEEYLIELITTKKGTHSDDYYYEKVLYYIGAFIRGAVKFSEKKKIKLLNLEKFVEILYNSICMKVSDRGRAIIYLNLIAVEVEGIDVQKICDFFIKTFDSKVLFENRHVFYCFAEEFYHEIGIKKCEDLVISYFGGGNYTISDGWDYDWLLTFMKKVNEADFQKIAKYIIPKPGSFDYSKDQEWSKEMISKIFKIAKKFQNKTDIEAFVEFLASYKNYDMIIDFAKNVKGADIKKLETAIIKTNKAKGLINFAANIEGADVPKLEKVIIDKHTTASKFEFAMKVKGANIEKLEDAIVKDKNPQFITKFAIEVKGANIEKLEDALIKDKNSKYITEFAMKVKGANIEKLEDALIKSNNFTEMKRFVSNINEANFKRIEDAIFEGGNSKQIMDFISETGTQDYAMVEEGIINHGTGREIYELIMMKTEDGEDDIIDLVSALLASRDAAAIYDFYLSDHGHAYTGSIVNRLCSIGDAGILCKLRNSLSCINFDNKYDKYINKLDSNIPFEATPEGIEFEKQKLQKVKNENELMEAMTEELLHQKVLRASNFDYPDWDEL